MSFGRSTFNRTSLAFIASAIALVVLVTMLAWEPIRDALRPKIPRALSSALHIETSPGPQAEPLFVYVAAGIRQPIEAAAKEYEQEYHVPVRFQFGPSEALLLPITTTGKGDLYIPGDDSYLNTARDRNLLDERIPLADMHPVIIVKKGNPKHINSINDLLKPDITCAIGNPKSAAVGKMTQRATRKTGQWDALDQRTTETGRQLLAEPDIANTVKIGSADAGIVWDTTVRRYPDLERIDDPAFIAATAKIAVGVLRSSKDPTAALRFARYLAARDRGLKEFQKSGYNTVEGDAWALSPDLHLLAGAMLRPAVEETITAFEQREGCRVTRVYNGCGILVAQMRAGEHPDAYFSCDVSFMTQVQDLFLDQTNVSQNQLAIIVPRGNPHHIHALPDLGQPGLRVGVGHEKQCAMGALTQTMLNQTGWRAQVMSNVKVTSPTGDFLVNQLRTGSLDAIIAYVSNVTASKDELETMPVDIPCAIATQPVAVGKDSQYKYMTQRLLDALESRQSKERFEAQGFKWKSAVKD